MKTPDLLDAKQKSSLLNSLCNGQIRRLFSKIIPHIEALVKVKPYPYFQNLPSESKKEKAAIAAWQSRFDSGYLENPEIHSVVSSTSPELLIAHLLKASAEPSYFDFCIAIEI